jgi:serine/threonine-protein kinase HipA
MSRVRELTVWMHDEPVARLTSRQPGRVALTYLPEVVDAHPGNVPLLSCSLPLGPRAQDAGPFVEGLLPEGQHRQAMAALAGVAAHDVMGLLARFGRDVAGALVVGRDDVAPIEPSVVPYTAASLAEELADLDTHPLGLHDDSELSLAGLQDKVLLVELPEGRWGRPVHGAPSTHLLKVDDVRHPGLVAAEHACLVLAGDAGLAAAQSTLLDIAGTSALAVRRFDRTSTPQGVRRLHQEDACQALGIDPEGNGRRAKYERYGGPTLRRVADLLARWAPDPEAELLALLDHVVLTVVIGNADAHGKNIALLHPAPGVVRLAPLYDTVPTALWPRLRSEAAMSVSGKWSLDTVTVEALVHEARSWSLAPAVTRARISDLLERLRQSVAAVAHTGVRDLVTSRLDTLESPRDGGV